jgi:hypothetical protein
MGLLQTADPGFQTAAEVCHRSETKGIYVSESELLLPTKDGFHHCPKSDGADCSMYCNPARQLGMFRNVSFFLQPGNQS